MERSLLIVICAAGLSGCFTSNVVVTVRPDGSGTLEQTATIRPAAMLEFDKLASPDLRLLALADLPGVTLGQEHEITIDIENPSTRIPTQPSQSPTAPAADTEIFLASLVVKDGKVAVGAPANITNSPGYDNQPSFTPDGKRILFASVRRAIPSLRDGGGIAGATSPATDIYRYDIESRSIVRLTNTPEGEFSPAVMPDGKNISVVRVEADGTQRLWRITDSDSNTTTAIILRDIKPVGYYAWIDDRRVALFVLGARGEPSTLQIANTQTGTAQTIATDIGRSIQRMRSGEVSFIAKQRDGSDASARVGQRLMRTVEQGTVRTEVLCAVPSHVSEPYPVWLPDGSALLAANATLYRWRHGETSWTPVADLGAFGLRDVTRLAISASDDRLAIVAAAK